MVHRIGQHDPVPVSALVMSGDQMEDLKAFLTDLIDKKSPPPAVLSDNQFEKLIATLQPGYELSTLYLAQYKQQNEPPRFADTPPAVNQEVPASEAPFVPPASPQVSPRSFSPPPGAPTEPTPWVAPATPKPDYDYSS